MYFLRPTAAIIILSTCLSTSSVRLTKNSIAPVTVHSHAKPKIQAAILLDVSNSMDGLIEQAKAQLWNMVTVMGKAKCNGEMPQIEIALYEYGSPRNDIAKGYVKQISPFTTDLDQLSQDLFSLTTSGGDEYCGHVIYNSINELSWDSSAGSYKVIFIAGNEDFLQGDISYTKACAEASEKGIIVNTIYCGDYMKGIKEHWHLGGECGGGSFTNIDQDVKIEEIPTPYDSSLMVLNYQLNETYLAYGYNGTANFLRQAEVDKLNSANKSASLKRTKAKAYAGVYQNSTWDLVDASIADSTFLAKVDVNTLPDSLRNKSRQEVEKIVKAKKEERANIQKQILTLSATREKFLITEGRKNTKTNNNQTFETVTEKIIREQAKRFNMIIE